MCTFPTRWKTSVGGNAADLRRVRITTLWKSLSVPVPWNSSETFWVMWAVIGALLCTWLDSLLHSMLCAVACWCWKPPPLRLSRDTFYLPPGRKSPRYLGSSQRSPGVCDCSCLKRLLGSKNLPCRKHLSTIFGCYKFNFSPQSFLRTCGYPP